MNRIKIGIPRALPYYYYDKFWEHFFEKLDVTIVYSPDTNNDILIRGNEYANDEMCLSLKVFLGHVDYLKDKCDYILIPRIENYGSRNQTCTNFLALYDLVNNLIDVNILNYNISSKDDELVGLINIGKELGINKFKIIKAYEYAKKQEKEYLSITNKTQLNNINNNQYNILLIAHPYVMYDKLIGQPIVDLLKKYKMNILYSDKFNHDLTNKNALDLSPNLYWKYSKENIGSISLVPEVNGIVFLSSFPCGLDSLVNEYMIRKLNKPYLNIIIDDIDSLTGMETRIESFVDIVTQN